MLVYRQKEDFYLDDDFGEIPKGWSLKKFIKCFEFFPTASYSREQLSESGDCCYIHYGDIHTKFDGFIDFKKENLPFVDKKMASRFTKLKEGDLIIADASEDYDGVGKAVEILNIGNVDAIAGLHTLHLRAIDNCLVNGFKAYVLNNSSVRNKILRSATGIKVYSISKSSLKNILIPIPRPSEQRTIANILSKVDEAIAATKNSIAKAERLKKALMQNLLTGKLKPDGTWRKEDEFYKYEKFGNVPKGWAVDRFDRLCQRRAEPYEPRKNKTSVRYVGLEHIEPNKFLLNGCGNSDETVSTKVKFYSGDVLYGKLRPYLNKVVKVDFDGVTTTECLVLYSETYLDWVYMNLQQSRFLNYTQSMTAGTQHPRVRWKDVAKYLIAYPEDMNELNEISRKISELEKNSKFKQNKIKKLERLKKALMQNLLTGKVRVKVPKEQLQTETW